MVFGCFAPLFFVLRGCWMLSFAGMVVVAVGGGDVVCHGRR